MIDVSYVKSHEAVIAHECGHAAMMIASGIVPESVDVSGQGEFRGVVKYPAELAGRTDRASLGIAAKVIMAAWLAEVGRPAAWPLGGASTDECDLANITEALGFDRDAYERFVTEVKATMASPAFTRPYYALVAAARHRPFLDSDAIRRVIGVKPAPERRTVPTKFLSSSPCQGRGTLRHSGR